MSHTNTWNAANEASPADSDNVSEGSGKIRTLKLDIRERINLDHYMDIAGTDAEHGQHRRVTLNAPISTPTHTRICTGSATSTSANQLVDSGADFVTDGIVAGDCVHNTTDDTEALVTSVVDLNTLNIDADIMVNGENYSIFEGGKSVLYPKDVSSRVELHFMGEDGREIQITDEGYLADRDVPADEIILFEKDTVVAGYTLLTDHNDMGIFITKGSAAGGKYGGVSWYSGNLSTGNATSYLANKLKDTGADFVTDGVTAGDVAINTTDGTAATVTAVDDLNTLSLSADIFDDGTEAYQVKQQGSWDLEDTDDEDAHTHTHNHKFYDNQAVGSSDSAWDTDGTPQVLAAGSGKKTSAPLYSIIGNASYVGDYQPIADQWTNNNSKAGSAHHHAMGTDWRPSARNFTRQQRN